MQDSIPLFAALNRELWLVTTAAGPRRAGLIATAVSNAALSPETPRVLVGIAKQHHTCGVIEEAGVLALHLLDEGRLDWVWSFGLRSGRDTDKFAGLTPQIAVTGSPLLDGALGWLDCRVEDRFDTGDRTVFLAAVEAARWTGGRPLTVHRLLEIAPPDRLAELKRQTDNDRAVQKEDVRRWRESRAGGSP